MLTRDNDFYKWVNTIQHNSVERRDISIILLNENIEPFRVWKVRNAWPCNLQSSVLKADANEIAIETIKLAHEGLLIEITDNYSTPVSYPRVWFFP
ncbi:MAG TPA: phage tail protein [Segetibacter sp.]|nr:phage tail protein [Segetibacter sp.]